MAMRRWLHEIRVNLHGDSSDATQCSPHRNRHELGMQHRIPARWKLLFRREHSAKRSPRRYIDWMGVRLRISDSQQLVHASLGEKLRDKTGLSYRKSLSAGTLRVNMSGSAIGVSVGVPGFRVGSGPRGNYVSVAIVSGVLAMTVCAVFRVATADAATALPPTALSKRTKLSRCNRKRALLLACSFSLHGSVHRKDVRHVQVRASCFWFRKVKREAQPSFSSRRADTSCILRRPDGPDVNSAVFRVATCRNTAVANGRRVTRARCKNEQFILCG